jgi:transcriptional regulatory protein LevR/transcriptional regulator with AAA-type ATPase domain
MKRIDTIYKRLQELSIESGVTAGKLAEDLGFSRANVSSDLNRLCDEGKAIKEGSKPVYYKAAAMSAVNENSLDSLSKNNPSLFHAVEQAKAAILYPPHGMHMLLFGETGVGKSMFAELIFQYGIEIGKFGSSAPFIVFNCADYANNPQLLVSQLFGTRKGAYTGAETEKPGLLEKADQGILFLDEIHRLPPEGQEMLFTFIDRGVYRRLGETDTERHSEVLIVAATTENPDSSLLRTFVRRIPMMIRIPNLEERSIDERLNLITRFLRRESARLCKPISVSVNSMRSLLAYRCPNNIGQLKTDIQLICAKAYSDFVSGRKKDIRIVSFDLPPYIKEGLLMETNHRQIWNRLIGVNQRYCVFDSSDNKLAFENNEDAETIYEMIDLKVKEFKERGMTDEQIDSELDGDIRSYFEKYLDIGNQDSNYSSLENLVGIDVLAVVEEILTYSEDLLDRHFSENIRYGLAVHIFNSINRVNRNRAIVNPQLNRIRKEHAQEFAVAVECLKLIDHTFEVSMPIDEAGFICMFFLLDQTGFHGRKGCVSVIVAAHGLTTATSMANACNRLLGMDYAVGFDEPLDENPHKIYNKLKEYLRNRENATDVLLLIDMGSFANFGDDLQTELGVRVKTIPLVSTLHVIEAIRKAAMGYPLDYVYKETLNVNHLLYGEPDNTSTKSYSDKMFILTICTTGEGSASVVKNYLEKQLHYNRLLFNILPLKIVDQEDIYSKINTIEHLGKIICIASSFKINLNIPSYGLDEIFSGKAVPKLQLLIQKEETFINIRNSLGNMLNNINNSKSFMNDIRQFIERVESRLGRNLNNNVLIGVSCHIGCMIDRLKGHGTITEYPQRIQYIQNNNEIIGIIRDESRLLNEKFEIQIPDDEVCYISTFFNPENCI